MSKNLRALAPSREPSPRSATQSSTKSARPWESPEWEEAVRQTPGLKPFFDNLESFVELPEGVAKLRELFLDLAVRGKLVEQDEDEGNANELLAAVANDRTEYLESNGLKKGKKLTPPNATVFKVPANWKLTHLEDLSYQIHYGYTASADANLRDVRMLRITDIQNNSVNWETVPGCQIEEEKVAQYELADNDLLIARTGGTIGKSFLIREVTVRSVFASYLIRVVPSALVYAKYIKRFLESAFYWSQLRAKSAGTGQPNVNATALKSLIVPLPPLAEQRRIVSKVEGLMSLCDTLEDARRARISVRERASRSVLASLTSAPRSLEDRERQGASRRSTSIDPDSKQPTASAMSLTKKPSSTAEPLTQPTLVGEASRGYRVNTAETLASSWQRLSDHFEILLDQPETVPHLRQSILQLAVQGKLVTQDPSDEPASLMLESLLAKRDELLNSGEIRKRKPLTVDQRGEPMFDAPDGWCWNHFENLADLTSGVTKGRKLGGRETEAYPYLRVANVQRWFVDTTVMK